MRVEKHVEKRVEKTWERKSEPSPLSTTLFPTSCATLLSGVTQLHGDLPD